MSAWKRLAEALGIETEANWDKLAKQRSMQRYGTQDRRTQTTPMQYFNLRGTGQAQRQTTMAAMQPRMTPKPGGMQIPAGTDRPGQINPLAAPPRKPAGPPAIAPLSTPPNSPQRLSGNSDDDSEEF
jgi:hypothetical protein